MFILGGIAIVVVGFARLAPGWMIGVILTCALVPVVYSFLLYRRIEGFADNGSEDEPEDASG